MKSLRSSRATLSLPLLLLFVLLVAVVAVDGLYPVADELVVPVPLGRGDDCRESKALVLSSQQLVSSASDVFL